MRKVQPYSSIFFLPFGVGDVCSVTWAEDEKAHGKSVAGHIVGKDNDGSHIYISIHPEHVGEACCGRISNRRTRKLGIERIACREIRVITPLRGFGDTSFMPRERYDRLYPKDI